MTEQPKESTPTKRRRWPRWVKIVSGCFLAGLLIVWNFLPAQTIDEPVVLERNTAGQLEAVEGDDQKGRIDVKAHAGTLTANSYTRSVGSTSVPDPDYFSNKSLAIINFSDHLLMSRVSEAVLNTFKKEQLFDRLEFYPVGHLPEPGSQSPDLILTLDLASLNESGTINKRLNANVKAYCGTELAQAHRSKTTELSPPSVDFFRDISVRHQSTYTGVESSAARYEQQGDNIAQEISNTLIDDLNNLHEKHTPQPELPKGFFPEYHPTPEFDFLITYQAKLLTSFHGLCFHNETFWLIENVDHVEETLKNIHQELEDQGWKGEIGKMDSLKVVQQRMEKSGDILEVFSPRDFSITQKIPTSFYVRYREPMKRDAYHAAYEELLKNPEQNINLLIELRGKASSVQRERLLKLVKEYPPTKASSWLSLAKHYQGRNDRGGMINALRNAHHLSSIIVQYAGQLQNEIDSIINEEEIELEQDDQLDADIFKHMGIPELKPDAPTVTRKIGDGETFSFLVQDKPNEWMVCSVIFYAGLPLNDNNRYDIAILESDSGYGINRSTSTYQPGPPEKYSNKIGNKRFKLEIQKTDENRIIVNAKLQD